MATRSAAGLGQAGTDLTHRRPPGRQLRAFLGAAHNLDVLPGDQTEVDLMRTVENAEAMRSALFDLDAHQ